MSTALATMKDRYVAAQSALTAASARIQAIIPPGSGLQAERAIQVVLDAISRESYVLLNCTPKSIVRSCIQASEIGLELGSVLGEAYLVPFKGQATMMIGYKGYVRLIRQAPRVTVIKSVLVRERDTFEVDEGENKIVHKLAQGTGRVRGEVTYAYSRVWYSDGFSQFEVMDRDELTAIEVKAIANSKGRPTPWKTNRDEMFKKCPIRRQAKVLELSSAGRRARELDDLESYRRGEYAALTQRKGEGFTTGRAAELADMMKRETEKAPIADAEILDDVLEEEGNS